MNCPNCGNPIGAEDVFCANCGTQVPTPEKKKSKKKIIIITSIVTALAIIAGILCWAFLFPEDPTDKPNEEDVLSFTREGDWVLTSETSYSAFYPDGRQQIKYTYDEKGMLLQTAIDYGVVERVWNESLQTYMPSHNPLDGNIDQIYEYIYNDQGDLLYYNYTKNEFNLDGELLDTRVTKYDEYSYNYDKNGRIESVDMVDGVMVDGVLHYCYDDNGNLIEIYTEDTKNDTTYWNYDFRYDSQNRLIGYTARRTVGCCYYYQYEYNDSNQLTYMSLSVGLYQSRLDDQHISESDTATNEEFALEYEVSFTYDNDGNLISREDDRGNKTTCTYDSNGYLRTVTYPDGTVYRYISEDADADSSETLLVLDKHGNIIKRIEPDGSYVEYTYQQLHLSEEDSRKCQSIQKSLLSTDAAGERSYEDSFEPGKAIYNYVSYPTTNLRPTDYLYEYT